MVNDLLKAASKFYKLSQDPLAPVRAAIEAALAPYAEVASIKTISLIDSDVKVAVHLEPSAGNSAGAVNRTMLQALLSAAVAKVNPALKTFVTIDISSEETLPKAAKLRDNFAKFHKLSQVPCQKGDPLCDDLNAGLPPDESKKPTPKPAPKPVPKPAPKPGDKNKLDDGLPADIIAALDSTVQGAKGSIRLDVNGKSVTVRYNSGRIKAKPDAVKQIFTSALSPLGYSVSDVYGETNVIPNY